MFWQDESFVEVGSFQRPKSGQAISGDVFLSEKVKHEPRIVSVLSDGLGSGVKASVDRMRGGVELVEHVLERARMAESAIHDIAKSSENLSGAVNEIVSSIAEQNAASTSVAQQIEDISRIAEESNVTMQKVVGTAGQVDSLSTQLKSTVAGFSI